MRFQPVKCNMMQLINKRSSKIQANYTLKGTVLENVESIKYLGKTITNDLKWNTHISNVCTKANRTLGFLKRNLYSCPPDVKEAAYLAQLPPFERFTASKGSNFYILFTITAAGVVPCGGPKNSPRTSSIVQIILFLSVL